MKKCIVLLSIFILMVSGSSWAEEAKKIAVLPFDVNSSENIDYIRDGVVEMLMSRLAIEDKIEVVDGATVVDLLAKIKKKVSSQADAYVLGKKLEAEYVVWGSISRNGKMTGIDAYLLDLASNKSPVTVSVQSQGMDEMVPKINDFAKRIDTHILGQVPSTFETTSAAALLPSISPSQQIQKPKSSTLSGETQAVDTLTSRKGTMTAVINPKSIPVVQVKPRDEISTSQKINAEFIGMDIGDVNRDGINEIVAIDRNNLFIYKKEGNSLKLLQKITKESPNQFLSVDVADFNASGIAQIFVSNVKQGIPSSFVLEYRDGNFIEIASDLKWLIRITYVSGKPVLLGQELGGKAKASFETPILELGWKNEEYIETGKMKSPLGLSIYDIAVGSLGNKGPNRIAAIDESGCIRIFQETDKTLKKLLGFFKPNEMLWKSDGKYGGTRNSFQTSPQLSAKKGAEMLNVRMFFQDLMNQGKKDLIVIENKFSGTGYFSDKKSSASAQVVDLEWSGKAFSEVWRSQKINGYIADMQVKDVGNDGQNELVLAIVETSSAAPSSVIVSYPLGSKISDSGLTTK